MSNALHLAAANLAGELQLPSWDGCVWVRDAGDEMRIVVAVDESWLRRHKPVPKTYMGFQVEVASRLSPVAGAR